MPRFPLPAIVLAAALPVLAQQQPPPPEPYVLTSEERQQIDSEKLTLEYAIRMLGATPGTADASVFLHAAEISDKLKLYTRRQHAASVVRGLQEGLRRCGSLLRRQRPWAERPGRSLRGYVSRIDGSVQPYGVVLPSGFDPTARTRWPLHVVLHGRGPTEITFLEQNEPLAGSPAARPPEQGFIELHPFGRGNNGWRWAGETDVFEALEAVRKEYPIDPQQIVLRGFSMGGHGAWHIGLHYPHLWSAVSPGAGFTDTLSYLRVIKSLPPHQEQARHIYDAVDHALNTFNTPFVAYGGEKDPQLQASLNMREACAREGLHLNMLIGPNTAHAYEPAVFREILRQTGEPRREHFPTELKFVTWTLKYNRCGWITLDRLGEHYRRAEVSADAAGPVVRIRTDSVEALTLLLVPSSASHVEIDGRRIALRGRLSERFVRRRERWSLADAREPNGNWKRHGLQGPIDDAFTERFLAVRGTRTPWSAASEAYAARELARFQDEWRFGFRGEVPLKADTAVTEADWKDSNLVLFGDPGSNAILARIADRLPLRWTREGVDAGGRRFGPECVPVFIYPNPLNPRRYVVVNTGHTWTRKDLLASNAWLFPRLGDWAVLRPGRAAPEVLVAGFFDERWRLPAIR